MNKHNVNEIDISDYCDNVICFSFTAKSLAKANLTNVRAFFDKNLDIAEDLIVVNAQLAQSPEMGAFRKTLRRTCDHIKVCRH